MVAGVPAPACTMTVCSRLAMSFLIVSGVAATRVSPGRISFGIPMRIRCVSVARRTVSQYSLRFLFTNHGGTENTEKYKNISVRSVSLWFVFEFGVTALVRPARERIATLDRAAIEATAQPADAVR